MNFYVSYDTDVGTRKQVNQDSLGIRSYALPFGNVAFAVLCDGMGGLAHGEIASHSIVSAFLEWADGFIPALSGPEIYDGDVRKQWTDIIASQNEMLRRFGEQNGFKIGSTLTAMLLTEARYYIMSIGDSRAYRINASGAVRLTTDHTVVENEIGLGNMTEAQALSSPMRSVLTKCIGIAETAEPDMFFGNPEPDTVYMLCSDGFRHTVAPEEIRECLYDGLNGVASALEERIRRMIELNKSRGETDNISAVTVYAV